MKDLVKAEVNRYRDKEWENKLNWETYKESEAGCFYIPVFKTAYGVIATTGMGWDHVSVQVHKEPRLPTWDEMQFMKELFFYPYETVMQLHPAQADYIDCHPKVLHLWRPIGFPIPMPPKDFV